MDPQTAMNHNGPDRFAETDTGSRDLFPVDALMAQEARVREFIQDHPLAVVCGALVFGFVVAKLMRIDA